uniref:CSON015397 protein n=1 Tax=Culicoides sonorensis TaxID=179676 RepID=A0A336MDE0_CULSO
MLKLIFAIFIVAASVPRSHSKNVVCYIPRWNSVASFADPSLCTHFLISFGIPMPDGSVDFGNISEFKRLRTPNSKLLLAIGGADAVSAANFPQVAANQRGGFAQNCFNIVRDEGLDGVDIDWEYPSTPEDKENFVLMMEELRNKFGSTYMLTTAVATTPERVEEAYDLERLTSLVDFFNLMTYDFHSDESWDEDWTQEEPRPHYGTYFNAPVIGPGNNVENGIKLYLYDKNIPAKKLNVGVPFYARVYKLLDPSKNLPRSECEIDNQKNDNFKPGYNEFCSALTNPSYTKIRDSTTLAPYMYNSSGFWISYEDQRSISVKANLANKYNLGGVMLWALNQDDYEGNCGKSCTWSLLKTLNYVVGRETSYCFGPPTITTCSSTGIFANPYNCKNMYVCERVGQLPIKGSCPNNYFFYEVEQRCLYISCIPKFTYV